MERDRPALCLKPLINRRHLSCIPRKDHLCLATFGGDRGIEIGAIAGARFDVICPKWWLHLKSLDEKHTIRIRMPLSILTLPAIFRPSTTVVYPPFKHGRYLEEYAYEYFLEHQDTIQTDYVYVPVFWTNLQNRAVFSKQREGLALLLQKALALHPTARFFTVVQHDDGPLLPLPAGTLVFGACTGAIPLPLIYEDTENTLLHYPRPCLSADQPKPYLASFVGTLTHPVREKMVRHLENKANVALVTKPHQEWTNDVTADAATTFVTLTLQSKFCLAPRGYGRSSFRFFEAMLLDVVPVYVWDDKEWLPYKDKVNYADFAISIQEKDIGKLYNILESISEERYREMQQNLRTHRHLFSLASMCEYITSMMATATYPDSR